MDNILISSSLRNLAQETIDLCMHKKVKVSTAESCTGGLIATVLTSVYGSSSVFDRGFSTYSNEAKQQMLGVSPFLIETHGAVSAEVALAMAVGALKNSNGQISVSVTGIAGPTGGSPEKPVGTVHIGCASIVSEAIQHLWYLTGDRHEVRAQAAELALKEIIKAADKF